MWITLSHLYFRDMVILAKLEESMKIMEVHGLKICFISVTREKHLNHFSFIVDRVQFHFTSKWIVTTDIASNALTPCVQSAIAECTQTQSRNVTHIHTHTHTHTHIYIYIFHTVFVRGIHWGDEYQICTYAVFVSRLTCIRHISCYFCLIIGHFAQALENACFWPSAH